MKYKIILLLLAFSTRSQSRSLEPRDLAEDVATALTAVDTSLADTNKLFETLNNVDDVLMFQVQALAGSIIVKLVTLGFGGTDLQHLQTIINNAEAVTVFQVYTQAYATLAHRDILTLTQEHLNNDLSQLTSDRDLLMTSLAELEIGFTTAFDLTENEVRKFNEHINSLIEGMEGQDVSDIKNSLALINIILSSTRNDITREKATMDTSTNTAIQAIEVVIAQVSAVIKT